MTCGQEADIHVVAAERPVPSAVTLRPASPLRHFRRCTQDILK